MRCVEILSLYYKVTGLFCFPYEKQEAQMLALLADVRRIVCEQGAKYFSMWHLAETLLDDCEKVIRREVTPEERKIKPRA